MMKNYTTKQTSGHTTANVHKFLDSFFLHIHFGWLLLTHSYSLAKKQAAC